MLDEQAGSSNTQAATELQEAFRIMPHTTDMGLPDGPPDEQYRDNCPDCSPGQTKAGFIREHCESIAGATLTEGPDGATCCTADVCVTCGEDDYCVLECKTDWCCELMDECLVITEHPELPERPGPIDLDDIVIDYHNDRTVDDDMPGATVETDTDLMTALFPEAMPRAQEDEVQESMPEAAAPRRGMRRMRNRR